MLMLMKRMEEGEFQQFSLDKPRINAVVDVVQYPTKDELIQLILDDAKLEVEIRKIARLTQKNDASDKKNTGKNNIFRI